ncbi:hypothetical protein NAEGRDRAFT_39279 [Naegleria gruberi]|uniref:tRNA-uridine aminocarboxypropyltransferase 1 n=1 Tax=Naegleria gruberi TaxID=5762 RepID=D2VGA7_NAEGR|nr:uncharacterized protein NAEGRDRAFT_39279 [Naegleria gruberi]EFC44237.1 hypothetical protein NAEGRDRAFT_39279 [Naegleria gruberi]|eukprot:XP_002676981.1 hypothetical protein NAEGRDRAFT_39279 [Naegleria gruberi strain NEG-M]
MVYSHFKISPFTNPTLSHIAKYDDKPKTPCPHCTKNRKYFCYDCCTPMIENPPTISKLPLHCVIIQHKQERKGKSTAIHAKVVAHSSADLYEFPDIPSFLTPQNCVLVYPSKTARLVSQLFKKPTDDNNTTTTSSSSTSSETAPTINVSTLKYAVFIDSTWPQAKQIYRNEFVKSLPCVIIEEKETLFWRYQREGQKFLSTIEAIFYFYREYLQALNEYGDEETKQSTPSDVPLENLLYYYIHQYCLIQSYYAKDLNKKITTKKADNQNYIKYDLMGVADENNSSNLEPPLKKLKED